MKHGLSRTVETALKEYFANCAVILRNSHGFQNSLFFSSLLAFANSAYSAQRREKTYASSRGRRPYNRIPYPFLYGSNRYKVSKGE